MAFLGGLLGGLGSILGGASKGAADERSTKNDFLSEQDRTRANIYGTRQGAILDALLQQGKDKMTGYQTRQGATTDAVRGKQDAYTQALANTSGEKIALAKLAQSAPMINAKQSILGSLLKNMQPHQFTSPAGQQGHLTKLSGGMSAANLDPITRQTGELLMQQALENQLSGKGVPGATDFLGGIQDWDKAVLDVPEATDYSKGIIDAPTLSPYQQAGKGESILSGLGTALGLAGAVGGAFSKPSSSPSVNNKLPASIGYTGRNNITMMPDDWTLPRVEQWARG